MKKLITSLALALTALSSYAITPLWMRDARISPNGTEIVFCYKGDIYKVPAQGGTAVQLTTQASYEANHVWSPDGFYSGRKVCTFLRIYSRPRR